MRYAVVLLLAVVPTSLAQPCYKVLTEYEPCPTCASSAIECDCVLSTGKCVPVEIQCRSRPIVVAGWYKLSERLEACEIHRLCRNAQNGDECSPTSHCYASASGIEVLTMVVSEAVDLCPIAHGGDRIPLESKTAIGWDTGS